MAKAVFVQKGDNIDFTAADAVEYMDVVPLEDMVGVALENIPAGGRVWFARIPQQITIPLSVMFRFFAMTSPS